MSEAKTYIFPEGGGSGSTDLGALALMQNGGLGGGNMAWWFLVLLFGWGRNGNGFGGGNDYATTELIRSGVQGNSTAISQLATTLNSDFNTVSTAINAVQSAIQSVGAQVGMSGQQVINAVQQGNMSLGQQIAQCCCDNKLLASQNHGAMMSRIDQLANGVTQGFSATAYATQQQTCDIIKNNDANTQRILDTLNGHWQADLQQRYNDVRLELSQKSQNEYLVSQFKQASGCGC